MDRVTRNLLTATGLWVIGWAVIFLGTAIADRLLFMMMAHSLLAVGALGLVVFLVLAARFRKYRAGWVAVGCILAFVAGFLANFGMLVQIGAALLVDPRLAAMNAP